MEERTVKQASLQLIVPAYSPQIRVHFQWYVRLQRTGQGTSFFHVSWTILNTLICWWPRWRKEWGAGTTSPSRNSGTWCSVLPARKPTWNLPSVRWEISGRTISSSMTMGSWKCPTCTHGQRKTPTMVNSSINSPPTSVTILHYLAPEEVSQLGNGLHESNANQ